MPLKLVIAEDIHSNGPSCIKNEWELPVKIYPLTPAKVIAIIAEPGKAKATGKPDPKASIIKMIKSIKKKVSIYLFFSNFSRFAKIKLQN